MQNGLGSRSTQPPLVARVRFFHIHDDELNLIPVLLVDLFETHGPLAEGGSGIAPENQGNWTVAPKVREAKHRFSARILKLEVRRKFPDLRGFEVVLELPVEFVYAPTLRIGKDLDAEVEPVLTLPDHEEEGDRGEGGRRMSDESAANPVCFGDPSLEGNQEREGANAREQ